MLKHCDWRNFTPPLILILTLTMLLWILWHGHLGPYILDDQLHFPKMENGINDTGSALRWVFSGGANATGRPISYLSFLIDDNAWPTSPGVFKTTNIFIHLLNSLLVLILARKLIKVYRGGYQLQLKDEICALLAMSIWAFQPMHLSAIFMAIQRMTLLMGTFSLLGLIFYVTGREKIANNKKRGYIYITLGIGFWGVLATFSKEPGILICAYAWILELTVFRSLKWNRPVLAVVWKAIFLTLPLLLLVAYYVYSSSGMEQLYLKREFTAYERVITQARVLVTYLGNIVFPSIGRSGPYHDDFVHSTGLFNPISTFLAIVIVIGLLITALIYRAKLPVFSSAILFFFTGHSLEASPLPIELYFEHRNYLPSLGICLGLSAAVIYIKKEWLWAGRLLLGFWGLLLVFILYNVSIIWGDRGLQSQFWLTKHLGSMRANLDAARYYLDAGAASTAKQILDKGKAAAPHNAGLQLYSYLLDNCKPDYPVRFYEEGALEEIIEDAHFDHASITSIKFLRQNIENSRCKVSYDEVIKIISLYLKNERFNSNDNAKASIYQELASVYAAKKDLNGTLSSLDEVFKAKPQYNVALNQVYIALVAGLYEEAQIFLDKAKSAPRVNKYEFLWRESEIDFWEEKLLKAKVERN